MDGHSVQYREGGNEEGLPPPPPLLSQNPCRSCCISPCDGHLELPTPPVLSPRGSAEPPCPSPSMSNVFRPLGLHHGLFRGQARTIIETRRPASPPSSGASASISTSASDDKIRQSSAHSLLSDRIHSPKGGTSTRHLQHLRHRVATATAAKTQSEPGETPSSAEQLWFGFASRLCIAALQISLRTDQQSLSEATLSPGGRRGSPILERCNWGRKSPNSPPCLEKRSPISSPTPLLRPSYFTRMHDVMNGHEETMEYMKHTQSRQEEEEEEEEEEEFVLESSLCRKMPE